eukprot:COSAG03_NODE_15839_length_419_cov_0.693750_1_plen_33_part_10
MQSVVYYKFTQGSGEVGKAKRNTKLLSEACCTW